MRSNRGVLPPSSFDQDPGLGPCGERLPREQFVAQLPGEAADRLKDRVRAALSNPASITRFGGLSLGESTHMIDEVCLLDHVKDRLADSGRAFLVAPKGRLTLPVWVDYVGSAGTHYATGNLEESPLDPPPIDRMPRIAP